MFHKAQLGTVYMKKFYLLGASTCTITHHATSKREGRLWVTLYLLHNYYQSQLCVVDWHSNTLIPLLKRLFSFYWNSYQEPVLPEHIPEPFLHHDTHLIYGGESLTQHISDLKLTVSFSRWWVTGPVSDTVSLLM